MKPTGIVSGIVGLLAILTDKIVHPPLSFMLIVSGMILIGFTIKCVCKFETHREPHYVYVDPGSRPSFEFFAGWTDMGEWKSILGNWSYVLVGITLLVVRYLFFR